MKFLGVDIGIRTLPELDPGFIPIHAFNTAFLAGAEKSVGIAVERADGQMASVETRIYGTEEMAGADRYYINRLVKTLLWMKGGFRIYVSGDRGIYDYLCRAYSSGGEQHFDRDYMSDVFEQPFEVVYVDRIPAAKD
ncbi:MAG: ROK family protein, partial [Candidatus Limivicinus sp.]|nr:ROK family protein [Candidatus Limivicinus sp.]